MTKEVTTYKPLQEVMEPLTKGQREYLVLRLMGLAVNEALRLANRKEGSLHIWKHEDGFNEVETYLLSNRDAYVKEAFGDAVSLTALKAQKVIEMLVDKALEWDNPEVLKQADKCYVMKAVELAKKMGIVERPENYEEAIFKMRRKL